VRSRDVPGRSAVSVMDSRLPDGADSTSSVGDREYQLAGR
jgi:hypothetical protein